MPIDRDLQGLLQDALHLQIDTVVKDAMTGRSMPAFPHALIDIARAYTRKLQALAPAPGSPAAADGKLLMVDLPFIFRTYLENCPWPPRPKSSGKAGEEPLEAPDGRGDAASVRFLTHLIEERERLARTAVFEEVARRAEPAGAARRDALLRPAAPSLDRDLLRTDWTTFAQLRLAATLAIHAVDDRGRPAIAPHDRIVAERIKAGCDIAKTLIVRLYHREAARPGFARRLWPGRQTPVARYPYRRWLALSRREIARLSAEGHEAPTLPPDEGARLRKYWELGTETILMQSVLSLGGDVITRVPPNRDAAGAIDPEIARLHQQAVGASTGMWRTMMEIVTDVLARLAGTLRPGG
jgi:hypothetical protein